LTGGKLCYIIIVQNTENGGIKMKKHTVRPCLIALAAVLALTASAASGCNKNNGGGESESGSQTSSVTSAQSETEKTEQTEQSEQTEKSEETSETEKAEEAEEAADEKQFSFFDMTVGETRDKRVEYRTDVPGHEYIYTFMYDGTLSGLDIISENAAAVHDNYYGNRLMRSSTGLLYTEKDSSDKMQEVLNEIDPLAAAPDTEGLYLTILPTVMTFKDIDSSKKTFTPDDVLCGYEFNDQVTGFIRCMAPNGYEFIPDPAYCYNLPVMHRKSGDCTYNINGTTVSMDSPYIYINDKSQAWYKDGDKEAFEEFRKTEGKFVYAKLSLSAGCYFSNNMGYIPAEGYKKITGAYINTDAYIYSFELISEDTDSVINDVYKTEQEDDPAASAVFSVLMDNMDTLYGENTLGIDLIDLDRDGTPEVIADSFKKVETDYGYKLSAEAKIYSIKDGGLVYVDTLYTLCNERENFISFGKDHNNKDAWFFISEKNVETGEPADIWYTFTMENGKLNYTEIFRTDITETPSERTFNYYYLGKLLKTEKDEDGKVYYPDYTIGGENLHVNPIQEMELFGMVQEDYCLRFGEIYNLFSPVFCSNNGYHTEFASFVPYSADKRSLSYKLAYVTDAYFEGEYLSKAAGYTYHFYGDYEKPVIYLYPEEKTDVSVKLDITDGQLTCTYPDYGDGWNVTAYPDGTIVDSDGSEYSYLYWEGSGTNRWDISEGFVVKGEDTAEFLREKLSYMGLTPKEYNEFIVYWLPRMQDNPYNLISFRGEDYTNAARLEITPEPDSLLRIFMVFAPLDEEIDIPPQQLETFDRKGFAAVEWGGAEIKK